MRRGQYTAAVANQNLPDEAAQAVAQADLWRQRGARMWRSASMNRP